MKLFVIISTLAVVTADVPMGKGKNFNLTESEASDTFVSPYPVEKLNKHEVLRFKVHPTGRRGARPTSLTPVWLWAEDPDQRYSWTLPRRIKKGPSYQWLEVLLCGNHPTMRLLASTNASEPVPLYWRVSTENVKLNNRIKMKSSPSDVSYRRYYWQPTDGADGDTSPLQVDVDITTVNGHHICARLVVTTRCVVQPYELTDEQMLHNVHFSQRARLTITYSETPDGFWLYLLPEWDNTLCASTAGRGIDSNPPAAKTVEVFTTERAFVLGDETTASRADWSSFPTGGLRSGGDDDSAWAGPQPPDGTCSDRVTRLQEQLRTEQQMCGLN